MLRYSDAGSGRKRAMFGFARHWPKAVIAIGILLTVAWMVFLAWLVVRVL